MDNTLNGTSPAQHANATEGTLEVSEAKGVGQATASSTLYFIYFLYIFSQVLELRTKEVVSDLLKRKMRRSENCEESLVT